MPRWFNSPLELHRKWKNNRLNLRCIDGQYKLLQEIGHGASGIVHLAVDIKTNIRYVKSLLFIYFTTSHLTLFFFLFIGHQRT